jgi:uncharacterized protein YdhG (YjbR/CyaY superfamily)
MSNTNSIDNYIATMSEDRKEAMSQLRNVIRKNLPKGFEETIANGMIAYVVPHELYPGGYHANPKHPLPFISIASQKNFIALYHMGLYASPDLLEWFQTEYPKHSKTKLDMGKGCVRFKKIDDLPFDLLSQLAARVKPSDWIKCYERAVNNNSKK